MSNFPNSIDDDSTLPRVFDNVSEVGAESYTALKEAIIAIENSIGTNPEGSLATLNARISASLNDNGTLKASALIAAGLVALPIDNAMVASSAAIEETKLDLDVATQTLQNQISSNDIDIAALQAAMTNLVADFIAHYTGADFKHDGFDILLDSSYPSSTPPWLTSITASDVSTAIREINDAFLGHTGASAAHTAANIACTDVFDGFSATNVQDALAGLNVVEENKFIIHRDDMHANGICVFENDESGYNRNLQLFPSTLGSVGTATVVSSTILDLGAAVSGFYIDSGDIVLIDSVIHIINDVGARGAVGSKPALSTNQIEIMLPLDVSSGTVDVQVFGKSSVNNLRATLAPTVYQADNLYVDSVQFARPGAAKAVSLGINPVFLDSSANLYLEVGVGPSLSRTVTITNLHYDRSGGAATTVSVDTVVERLNYLFQNGTVGNALPVSAYRVGDELAIVHNWVGSTDYWLKVSSSGSGATAANRFLGFDSEGANIVDQTLRPSYNSYFYVNGEKLTDFATIYSGPAAVSGQTFTLTVNPVELGIKIGHLIHLKEHATTAEIGTYFITNVTSTTVVVNQPGLIATDASVQVEILHDCAPLNEFNTAGTDVVAELYVDSAGRIGHNERARYTDTISNISIVDISDSFRAAASAYTLTVTADTTDRIFSLGIGGTDKTYASTFVGRFRLYGPTNVDWIEIETSNPIGTGTSSINVYDHVDEEELFELCSVKINGVLTVTDVHDKRLFGTTGLDEIRDDVVQAYIETPLSELRSNGVVYGFDIVESSGSPLINNPASSPYPTNTKGISFKGGVAYVDGARVVVASATVYLPPVNGTYYICLNAKGSYVVINSADFDLEDILDGKAGSFAVIASAVYSSPNITAATSLVFRLDRLDDKVEMLVDLTNHNIGEFSSIEAAIAYINAYPSAEKFKVRIVSRTDDTVTITGLTRDATFVLDGIVDTLTVQSSCRIIAESYINRTDAHVASLNISAAAANIDISGLVISGATTLAVQSGGRYSFTDTVWNGDGSTIDVSGSGADEISFVGCAFLGDHGGVQFADADHQRLVMSRCRFESTEGNERVSTLSSENTVVSDCSFKYHGINFASKSETVEFIVDGGASDFVVDSNFSRLFLTNCLFDGFTNSATAQYVLDCNGMVAVRGCHFTNLERALGSLIRFSSTQFTQTISDCVFRNCTFTSTGDYQLMETRADIVNCQFVGMNVYNSNILIECNRFEGCYHSGIVGDEFAIAAIDFIKNTGFYKVVAASYGSGLAKTVAGNSFYVSTLYAHSVVVSSDTTIAGNTFFHQGGSGASAIVMADSSVVSVSIIDNVFTTGTNNNYGIDLGSIGSGADCKVLVASNRFSDTIPFALNSAGIQGLSVVDNYFGGEGDAGASFQLELGSDCVFDGNKGNTLTLSGAITSLLITSNHIDLTVTGTLNDFSISANHSDMEFSGGITNGIISSNRGALTTSATMTGCSVTGNYVSGLSIGALCLDSVITSNVFDSITAFYLSNSTFSNNAIGSDVEVGVVTGVVFQSNTNIDYPTVHTVTATSCSDTTFDGNSGFTLNLSNVANSIISNNILLNGDIILAGEVTQSTVSGNSTNSIQFGTYYADNSTVSNNVIYDSLYMGVSDDTSEFNSMVITGNSINDSIAILEYEGTGAKSMYNSVLTGNKAGDIQIFGVGYLSSPLTDSYEFYDNTISNNTLATLNVLADNAHIYSDVTFTRNSFIGNNISGDFTFSGAGGRSGGNPIVFRNTDIISNTINGELSFIRDLDYDKLKVSGNKITDLVFPLAGLSATHDYDDLRIESNVVSGNFDLEILSDGDVTLDSVKISGNTFTSVGNIEIGTGDSSYFVSGVNNYTINSFIFTENTLYRMTISRHSSDAGSTLHLTQGSSISGNNFFGPGCGISIADNNVLTIDSMVASRNIYTGSIGGECQFILLCSNADATRTLSVTGLTFSDNSSIDFRWAGDGVVHMYSSSITNNYFDGTNTSIMYTTPTALNKSLMYQLVVSGNRNASIEIGYFWSISYLNVSNNAVSGSLRIYQGAAVGGAAPTFAVIQISSNLVDDNIDVRDVRSQATTPSVTGQDVILISGNTCDALSVVPLDSTSDIVNVTILSNYTNTISIEGSQRIRECNVSGNTCFDILMGAYAEIIRCIISGNYLTVGDTSNSELRLYTYDTSTTIGDCSISSNIISGTITINTGLGAFQNSILSSNVILTSNAALSGDLDLSLCGQILKLTLSGNIVADDIILPTVGNFGGGASQSIFVFNRAANWVGDAGGPINTSSGGGYDNIIFAWGNISEGATSNVSLLGTAATNISTANSVSGAGGYIPS